MKVNFLFSEGEVLYLRVDPIGKLVQIKTVLQFITEKYNAPEYIKKERDEKRVVVKELLTGKVIMTNYGKAKYVTIEDVEFRPL